MKRKIPNMLRRNTLMNVNRISTIIDKYNGYIRKYIVKAYIYIYKYSHWRQCIDTYSMRNTIKCR